MARSYAHLTVLLALGFTRTLPLLGQTPLGSGFTYQGKISQDGSPLNGPADFGFSLWNAASGPSQLGSTQLVLNVDVEDGLFTVPDVNASGQFGPNGFSGDERWLEIAVRSPAGVGSFVTLSPRQKITAAPYALDVRGPLNVSGEYPGGQAVTGRNSTTVGLSYGVVGETDSPNGGAGVAGTANATTGIIYGGYFASNSTAGYGVYGLAGHTGAASGTGMYGVVGDSRATSGPGYGMFGMSSSTSGVGVLGRATATSGTTYGLYGESASIGGAGVTGVATATTGATIGVYGEVASAAGEAIRGYAYATSGVNYGGRFECRSPGGYGGYFINTGGGVALKADGTAQVNVLEILGADVAEKFPVSEQIDPGMVVAIDPDHPGQLCLARGACNRRVAGVASGAGGLSVGAVLGNLPGSEKSPPIALTGRVWVYCDAADQPIEPGDLLTTSDTPGHAMKVTDPARAQGAVIGKAMTGLTSGRGLVLVLVSLQ